MTEVEKRVQQWLFRKLGFKPHRKQILQFCLHVFPIEKSLDLKDIRKDIKNLFYGIWMDGVYRTPMFTEKLERIQEITQIKSKKVLIRLIVSYVAYLLYDSHKIKDKNKISEIVKYYFSIERPNRRKPRFPKPSNPSP